MALVLTACAGTPGAPAWPSERIAVGEGPEDLVLDTLTGPARLLVSCHDRRAERAGGQGYGGFWSIDPATGRSEEIARSGEPAWLPIHPHGIDLRATPAGPRLYAILHDDARDVHRVAVYAVERDRLVFETVLADPLLVSPNAVAALPGGDLLVTNDSGRRGSRTEALFKRRRANVLRYDASAGGWQVAADGLAYANGVTIRGDHAYVAATRGNRVYRYALPQTGPLGERVELGRVPGADNLRWHGDRLLVPGHPDILAFARHAGNPARRSPVEVWSVAASGEDAPRRLWADDGSTLSAASTALVHDGRLWLAQVFDGFVLVVDLP